MGMLFDFRSKVKTDFTEEEIKKYIDIKFQIYDKNKSNYLEFDEFHKCVFDIFESVLDSYSETDIDDSFVEYDFDRDGKISREDFKPLIEKVTQNIKDPAIYVLLKRYLNEEQKPKEEFMKELDDPVIIDHFFKEFDKNKTGYLEIREFAHMIFSLGFKFCKTKLKFGNDIEKYFMQYDIDKDDKISRLEFPQLFKDLMIARYDLGYIGFKNENLLTKIEYFYTFYF